MAFPASAVPATHTYCVHFFGSENSDLLSKAASATESLLKKAKIAIRKNPDKTLWKSTLALVDCDDFNPGERPAFVNGNCLLVATTSNPDALNQNPDWICVPDLWLIPATEDIDSVLSDWKKKGAGAVAVFNSDRTVWNSANDAFAQSQGVHHHPYDAENEKRDSNFASSISGVLCALAEELLGENIFDKTSIELDRECLEMRPLHLGQAAESGLAFSMLNRKNETLKNSRQELEKQLQIWRGPVAQSWGGRGR